ncbi:unnamed protein product [Orchesella dallaii]|uniref:Uncharacterized protein n=1 Tax=Orchesella dallaii TaxID=48710 RepID=A0ABP1PSN6_9HEXA
MRGGIKQSPYLYIKSYEKEPVSVVDLSGDSSEEYGVNTLVISGVQGSRLETFPPSPYSCRPYSPTDPPISPQSLDPRHWDYTAPSPIVFDNELNLSIVDFEMSPSSYPTEHELESQEAEERERENLLGIGLGHYSDTGKARGTVSSASNQIRRPSEWAQVGPRRGSA